MLDQLEEMTIRSKNMLILLLSRIMVLMLRVNNDYNITSYQRRIGKLLYLTCPNISYTAYGVLGPLKHVSESHMLDHKHPENKRLDPPLS